MKKKDVINLFIALSTLPATKGAKFSYAVAKNLSVLKDEVISLESGLKILDESKEYEKARLELLKSYAEKDENNNPVTKNNGKEFVIVDQEKFEKEFEDLKVEHASGYTVRQKQIDEYEEMLEEEATVDIFKVKLANVPDDVTPAQMYSIFAIIDDTEQETEISKNA